jgi:hypothetical protein
MRDLVSSAENCETCITAKTIATAEPSTQTKSMILRWEDFSPANKPGRPAKAMIVEIIVPLAHRAVAKIESEFPGIS